LLTMPANPRSSNIEFDVQYIQSTFPLSTVLDYPDIPFPCVRRNKRIIFVFAFCDRCSHVSIEIAARRATHGECRCAEKQTRKEKRRHKKLQEVCTRYTLTIQLRPPKRQRGDLRFGRDNGRPCCNNDYQHAI